MKIKNYDRIKAVEYAEKWAFSRNPDYYSFDSIGGDCTNFISQCIYAGSDVMNYTPVYGWYYINLDNRSPSWTSVKYLYKFLTKSTGTGPFGKVLPLEYSEIGDIIQLGNDFSFYHSLIIVKKESQRPSNNFSNIYVAAHDFNTYMKPLSSYSFKQFRMIHIEGVRT